MRTRQRPAPAPRSAPWFKQVEAIVHRTLTAHGKRPHVSDVADAFDLTALRLRRTLRDDHAGTCREMIAYACVSFAVERIKEGWKIESAMMAAGLRNKTSFCRECREFFGRQPHELRGGGGLLSRKRIERTAAACGVAA